MEERWRQVECAPEYYVSESGKVRNRHGRELKATPNNRTGKAQVTLTTEGYRLTRPVHKLVEEAFDW